MNDESQEILRQKLESLLLEHRDLDDVIRHLTQDPSFNELQLSRMKKRKLMLKDAISRIKSRLIPDIEA